MRAWNCAPPAKMPNWPCAKYLLLELETRWALRPSAKAIIAEYCCSPHRRCSRFLGAPTLPLSPLLPLARWRAMRRRGKARRIVAPVTTYAPFWRSL